MALFHAFAGPVARNAAITALITLTAFYATYKLTESPPTWYDEGIYIQVAHSFSERGTQSIQVAPGTYEQIDFLTIGYPLIAPVALSMHIFDHPIFAARIVMVIFILAFVFAAWALLVRLTTQLDALLGIALLATFPLLYGNGKNMLGEIPGLFFASLTLMLLHKLETEQYTGVWNYIMLGIMTGLTAATKPVYLLVPLGICIVLIFNLRSIILRWNYILLGIISFCIPMALWIYFQFGADARISEILQYYANPYGIASIPTTISENFLRFFTESTPMYFALLLGAWLISICIRLLRKEHISLAEQSALAFSLLVTVAYLRTAGWYRYFFQAMILALIFLPHSLNVITSLAEASRWRNLLKRAPVVLVTLLCAMQLYQLNFSSWVAEHYGSTTVADTLAYFEGFPVEKSVFVYNSPEAPNLIHTNNYYQYMQPTESISYGKQYLPLLETGVPDYVLIAPGNYEKHVDLFRRYPIQNNAGPYLLLSKSP